MTFFFILSTRGSQLNKKRVCLKCSKDVGKLLFGQGELKMILN